MEKINVDVPAKSQLVWEYQTVYCVFRWGLTLMPEYDILYVVDIIYLADQNTEG